MKIRTKENMTPEELAEAEKLLALSDDVPSNAEVVSSEASPEIHQFVQDVVHGVGNTKQISIKFDPVLLDAIKELALKNHVGYQTYIKLVLAKHVNSQKRRESNKSNMGA